MPRSGARPIFALFRLTNWPPDAGIRNHTGCVSLGNAARPCAAIESTPGRSMVTFARCQMKLDHVNVYALTKAKLDDHRHRLLASKKSQGAVDGLMRAVGRKPVSAVIGPHHHPDHSIGVWSQNRNTGQAG